jgi:hypothetical protein
MTEANCEPFSSRVRRFAVGVLALKNVAQFASIAEIAAEPVVGSDAAAGEVTGADETGAVVWVGVVVGVFGGLLLLHAARARPTATSSAAEAARDW